MKRTLRLLTLAACLPLCGCVATNIAEFQKAMAGDSATVVADFNTVYGKFHLVRVGGEPGTTKTVAPDGTVTIHSN